MNTDPFYYILTFPTTTAVMAAEKYIKQFFAVTIMPVPREISAGCGLSIRFMNSQTEEEKITAFYKSTPLEGTLYKMYTKRLGGRHPIEKVNELLITKKDAYGSHPSS